MTGDHGRAAQPTTAQPTTAQPTTAQPTTAQPTTAQLRTAQPAAAEPAAYADELPGDPACLLRRVCQACGAVAGTDPPAICPQCGAELPGT